MESLDAESQWKVARESHNKKLQCSRSTDTVLLNKLAQDVQFCNGSVVAFKVAREIQSGQRRKHSDTKNSMSNCREKKSLDGQFNLQHPGAHDHMRLII